MSFQVSYNKHNSYYIPMIQMRLAQYLLDVKLWMIAVGTTLLETLVVDFQPIPWIQKYIFSDFTFLKWLMIVMFIDLITGIARVWRTEGLHKVTSRGIRDTVIKVIQYGAFLIITHIVTHFEIGGQKSFENIDWVNKLAYQFLILIEIKSVYENIVKMNPGLDFMKTIIDKILFAVNQSRDKKLDNFTIDKEEENEQKPNP